MSSPDRVHVQQLFNLAGKVGLVIGGARHLGYDMAEALAEAGAAVAITSRSAEAARSAATKLAEATGVATLPLALDQRDPAQVKTAFAEALRWQGRLDIVIANAGGGSGATPALIFERDPRDVESLIATNLTGTLHCCQEAARIMREQRAGKIITVASVAGLVGRDRRMYAANDMRGQPVDYAAAKAGVIGLTRDLAGLLGPFGICVNCISPGGFERDNLKPGFVRDYSERTPLGRMGRDRIDLKGAALFLASAASDYVTGHNLVVDGGFALWR